MKTATQKAAIIKWINSIEDPSIIEQINTYRKQKTIDFDKEIKKAITGDELKKRTTQFLESLDWKK